MIQFEEVFNAYQGKVRNYLTKILGQCDAEDVAQEVFIKINKNLSSLKEEDKLQAWIFKIAKNAARDSLRKKANCRYAETADNKSEIADTRQRSPEEQLIRKEMAQCYMSHIQGLPIKYREVYILSEVEGLTAGEISEMMSLSIEAVKMRLHRARNGLFDALRENCQSYHTAHGELLAEQVGFAEKIRLSVSF